MQQCQQKQLGTLIIFGKIPFALVNKIIAGILTKNLNDPANIGLPLQAPALYAPANAAVMLPVLQGRMLPHPFPQGVFGAWLRGPLAAPNPGIIPPPQGPPPAANVLPPLAQGAEPVYNAAPINNTIANPYMPAAMARQANGLNAGHPAAVLHAANMIGNPADGMAALQLLPL
jgi:hypothetical protein